MGTRAGLDKVVRTLNSSLCRELKAGRPGRSLVTILTELPQILILSM